MRNPFTEAAGKAAVWARRARKEHCTTFCERRFRMPDESFVCVDCNEEFESKADVKAHEPDCPRAEKPQLLE